MDTPFRTQPCSLCWQHESQSSVLRGICRTCVEQMATDALAEMGTIPGGITGDCFGLDRGALRVAYFPDALGADADCVTFDGFAEEDQYRLDLLWVFAAEVDRLRGRLADAESALSEHGCADGQSITEAVAQLAAKGQRAVDDASANRRLLEDLAASFNELRRSYLDTLMHFEIVDAGARHVAAVARAALTAQHRLSEHSGHPASCHDCSGEWAVANAVITADRL